MRGEGRKRADKMGLRGMSDSVCAERSCGVWRSGMRELNCVCVRVAVMRESRLTAEIALQGYLSERDDSKPKTLSKVKFSQTRKTQERSLLDIILTVIVS